MTAGIVKSSRRPDRRQAGRALVFALAVAVLLPAVPGPAAEHSNAPWPWPVPVDPPQITATFMEARTGGYHTGLDIRTMGRTGLPVSTPLAGSVVRVRTSPEGYGKVVYLDVGGGRTLVFAHLSAFADPIQQRIAERQAATREYAQQIYLEPGELTFEVGDVIALSGDTGIGAPHLHFEVREGDVPINPIDFFDVPDTEPPVITGIEVVPAERGAQVQGRAEPMRVAHGDTVRVHGRVGVRIGVAESTGINGFGLMPRAAVLRLDDGRSYSLAQDSIAFDDRWQRGLELERAEDGSRWLALFRHPANSHRDAENGFEGVVALAPGEVLSATAIARDHVQQRAAVRLVFRGVPLDPRADAALEQSIWFSAGDVAGEQPAVQRIGQDVDLVVRPDGRSHAGAPVRVTSVQTDAPERHDGLGFAFELDAPYVAFRRGIEVSVEVPGDPAEYTLNARDRRGRWSPESGVVADSDREGAIRTRLVDTGIYRVVRDVTPPGLGPWIVDGRQVRDDVTLRAREDVRHGITLPRWPALRLDVADAIAGIDPEDVRVTLNGEPYPARPELEDDHVWIEWEVDPGPGTYDVRVEVADRLGNAASARITARLVE